MRIIGHVAQSPSFSKSSWSNFAWFCSTPSDQHRRRTTTDISKGSNNFRKLKKFLLQVDFLATVKTHLPRISDTERARRNNIFPQFHFIFSVIFLMKPFMQVFFYNMLSFSCSVSVTPISQQIRVKLSFKKENKCFVMRTKWAHKWGQKLSHTLHKQS